MVFIAQNHPPLCQARTPLALILNGVTVTPDLLWSTTQETNEGLHLYRAAVSIIEILSMCDEYNENSGVREEWVWIIVSSVIISLREHKKKKTWFFFLIETFYTYAVRFLRSTVSTRWYRLLPCGPNTHGTCKLVACSCNIFVFVKEAH